MSIGKPKPLGCSLWPTSEPTMLYCSQSLALVDALRMTLTEPLPLSEEDAEEPPPVESTAPVMYTTLERAHLGQVHDLLERAFWSGIDGMCYR